MERCRWSPSHDRLFPAFLALAFLVCPACARTITGKARIIDRDTIEVAGTRVRLEGIDAPERGQECQVHTANLGHFDKNAG